MDKIIGDKIDVKNMGFMGFETYTGKVRGITKKYYIVDFGKDQRPDVEQRFQIVNKQNNKNER